MTTKAMAFLGWIDARFPLTKLWKEHLSEYYAPKNFNFWYFFGSLALLVLVMQILTGIFITCQTSECYRIGTVCICNC